LVPEAPFIPKVSYEEAITMAENGAKVIHPRAVKAAKQFNLKVRVKSTFDDSEGTLVGPEASDLIVSGISAAKDLAVAKYERERAFTDDEVAKLQTLSADKTLYDSNSEERVILISEEDKDTAKSLAEELNAQVNFFENMSKVSAVYKATIDSRAVDEKIMATLLKEDIQVIAKKVLADHCAYIVKNDCVGKCVKAIYKTYFN